MFYRTNTADYPSCRRPTGTRRARYLEVSNLGAVAVIRTLHLSNQSTGGRCVQFPAHPQDGELNMGKVYGVLKISACNNRFQVADYALVKGGNYDSFFFVLQI